MKNPWLNFVKNLDDKNLVLDEEKIVIEKFNRKAKENFKIHTEIMPAPFMGNVKSAPIVLLTLNPGYDKNEEFGEFGNYYEVYKPFWKNEIQHIKSIPELPLFCLDEEYIRFSNYWNTKLKPLILISSKQKVAKNICKIQFFPYHSQKFKNISKVILREEGFDFLTSQKYNFNLVKQAMERNAVIIILRSKKLWLDAIPELNDYKNLRFTNNYRNTIISEGNLPKSFTEIGNILNGNIDK